MHQTYTIQGMITISTDNNDDSKNIQCIITSHLQMSTYETIHIDVNTLTHTTSDSRRISDLEEHTPLNSAIDSNALEIKWELGTHIQ